MAYEFTENGYVMADRVSAMAVAVTFDAWILGTQESCFNWTLLWLLMLGTQKS